jgi:arabinogalactan endo-1,4-beta-galactosidase
VTALRSNVNALATSFGKDIVIAEMQYASTLANGDTTGNFVWQASQFERGYPGSAGGQLSLANDLLSILAHVRAGTARDSSTGSPSGCPGWVGSPAPARRTTYDFQGRTLPSISIFEDPVAVCQGYNRYGVRCVISS